MARVMHTHDKDWLVLFLVGCVLVAALVVFG